MGLPSVVYPSRSHGYVFTFPLHFRFCLSPLLHHIREGGLALQEEGVAQDGNHEANPCLEG